MVIRRNKSLVDLLHNLRCFVALTKEVMLLGLMIGVDKLMYVIHNIMILLLLFELFSFFLISLISKIFYIVGNVSKKKGRITTCKHTS